jgi:hypothetical protein
MFNNLFCLSHHVDKRAFKFDGYVKYVFKKFLLDVVEISVSSWCFVFLIILVNVGRLEFEVQPYSCDLITHYNSSATSDASFVISGGSESHEPTTSSLTYKHCVYERSLSIFTSAGLLLCVMTVLLAVATRAYELRLLDISSIDDYPKILEDSEGVHLQNLDSNLNNDEYSKKLQKIKREAGFLLTKDDLKVKLIILL